VNYLLTSNGLNLAYTALALLLVYGASRFLNWHNGVKFSEHVLGKVHNDPTASALYYGLRWIGICIVAASLIVH
jgi:hypothetical protein